MQEPEKGYPKRLHHEVPHWVHDGAQFHIRLRTEAESSPPLIEPSLATELISAAQYYHEQRRWFCRLFLLMPDHIHAIISFPPNAGMSPIIGEWKRYTARSLGIRWQSNYFDHRLRDESEATKTYAYILQNPVASELCARDTNWHWQWRSEDSFVWNSPPK
jgi:REP element-mobilizing transposase RayT